MPRGSRSRASTNGPAPSTAAISSTVTPGRADRPLDGDASRARQRRQPLEPALDVLELVDGPADEPEGLARRGAGHDRLVQVGQVLHDLVGAPDREEVDAPRPADPPPHLLPGLGQLRRSAVSTGRAAIQS